MAAVPASCCWLIHDTSLRIQVEIPKSHEHKIRKKAKEKQDERDVFELSECVNLTVTTMMIETQDEGRFHNGKVLLRVDSEDANWKVGSLTYKYHSSTSGSIAYYTIDLDDNAYLTISCLGTVEKKGSVWLAFHSILEARVFYTNDLDGEGVHHFLLHSVTEGVHHFVSTTQNPGAAAASDFVWGGSRQNGIMKHNSFLNNQHYGTEVQPLFESWLNTRKSIVNRDTVALATLGLSRMVPADAEASENLLQKLHQQSEDLERRRLDLVKRKFGGNAVRTMDEATKDKYAVILNDPRCWVYRKVSEDMVLYPIKFGSEKKLLYGKPGVMESACVVM